MWKAAQLLTAIGKAAPRDCITEARLVEITGTDAKGVENHCRTLLRNGLIRRTGPGCHVLTAAGRAAIEQGATVRSGPKGQRTGHLVRRGTVRERAWAAMRIKRKFSIDDLVMLVIRGDEGDIRGNVQQYLYALARAGFVRQLPQREQGTDPTSNGFVRFLLIADRGPLPPAVRATRRCVYDPNNETSYRFADAVPRASRRRPREA